VWCSRVSVSPRSSPTSMGRKSSLHCTRTHARPTRTSSSLVRTTRKAEECSLLCLERPNPTTQPLAHHTAACCSFRKVHRSVSSQLDEPPGDAQGLTGVHTGLGDASDVLKQSADGKERGLHRIVSTYQVPAVASRDDCDMNLFILVELFIHVTKPFF
jgi:hypothetical protein